MVKIIESTDLTDPKHQVDLLHYIISVQTQSSWIRKNTQKAIPRPPVSSHVLYLDTHVCTTTDALLDFDVNVCSCSHDLLFLLADSRAGSVLLLTQCLVQHRYVPTPLQWLDVFFTELPFCIPTLCHRAPQHNYTAEENITMYTAKMKLESNDALHEGMV